MNKLVNNLKTNPLNYLRMLYNVQNVTQKSVLSSPYSTTVDVFEPLSIDHMLKQRLILNNSYDDANSNKTLKHFIDKEAKSQELIEMTEEQCDAFILNLLSKNKDKNVTAFLINCTNISNKLSDVTIKKLFMKYGTGGKPEMVEVLRNYCSKVNPYLYEQNGSFTHYLAKAQCMKGNSEKGLVILAECYKKYKGLRSFYRITFRELIQDSVLNRSEASLVIFKKYVLKFSKQWKDHYPLICLWHICWSSTWYSDQVLADELLENSVDLQNIVKDKATAFSISILNQEYNEDAVMRLLQALLKYEMMFEYANVLQELFTYKLKTRDLRGCTEIIRNCEVLGINLPQAQQGRYIRMLINRDQPETNKTFKYFKLQF